MKVEIGSIWINKQNGLPAKVVDRTLTPYFQQVQLTVIYDSLDGQGFQPGILPSTWFEEHWEEKFRKPEPGEVGFEQPGVPDGAVAVGETQ